MTHTQRIIRISFFAIVGILGIAYALHHIDAGNWVNAVCGTAVAVFAFVKADKEKQKMNK